MKGSVALKGVTWVGNRRGKPGGEMIASRSLPVRDGQLGLVGLSLTCDGEG